MRFQGFCGIGTGEQYTRHHAGQHSVSSKGVRYLTGVTFITVLRKNGDNRTVHSTAAGGHVPQSDRDCTLCTSSNSTM